MKRAVIIAGGNVCREDFEQIQPGDFVICADGGLDHAEAFGIVPDIVLGDFDSVKRKSAGTGRNGFRRRRIRLTASCAWIMLSRMDFGILRF